MLYEISQEFFFDAAHTLERAIEAAGSRRIHGHTYHARATVRGTPDPATDMVFDLGLLRSLLDELRGMLDHHFLDEVPGLGKPTLENLARFIAQGLRSHGCPVCMVEVWRQARGDHCRLVLDAADTATGTDAAPDPRSGFHADRRTRVHPAFSTSEPAGTGAAPCV